MSLKKPKSRPDIPGSRKKNPEKIKEAVPAKKSSEIEYKCRVYFAYNPSKKPQNYALEIETTKLFSVLNYNISFESKKTKNVIDINIMGLKATNNYTNEPGPAAAVIYFEELYGNQIINIIKQDGGVNSAVFNFNVFKKSIELLEEFVPPGKNNSRFCDFEVAKEKFRFA
jgi:hypothetical protein